MKEYLKSEIKHIPLVLILFILFYGITTLATTTLFNSNEVKYNNTTSGIQSDKVQGAIDELYACASNYGAYNTRLTNIENTIGTGSLTTTNKTLIGGVNELNGNISNWEDISRNCTWGSVTGSSGRAYYNSKLKLLWLAFTVASGTANEAILVTIPSNLRFVTGAYSGEFRKESNGNLIGYYINGNARTIKASYSQPTTSIDLNAVNLTVPVKTV